MNRLVSGRAERVSHSVWWWSFIKCNKIFVNVPYINGQFLKRLGTIYNLLILLKKTSHVNGPEVESEIKLIFSNLFFNLVQYNDDVDMQFNEVLIYTTYK